MKKKAVSLSAIVMCILMILPMEVLALSYAPNGTDISIAIDDAWFVFTRENIENNPELADLGIAYENIQDFMYINDVYIDAIIIYDDLHTYLELFLRKVEGDDGMNLSEFSDDEVLETIEEMAEQCGSTEYGIYQTEYKFSKMEYTQEEYHIMEYITIVNGDTYTLGFQSNEPFDDWAYGEMDRIVETVVFEVETPYVDKYDDIAVSEDVEIPPKSPGAAVIVSAVVSGVAWLLRRGKREDGEDRAEESIERSTTSAERTEESGETRN